MTTRTESTGLSLLTDVISFAPAPTPAREAVAALINLAIVGVLLAVVGPHPLMVAVVVASVIFFVIRFAIGSRSWRRDRRRS